MLISRSVLVRLRHKWQTMAVYIRLYMNYYEFIATVLCTAKLHFSGGKIWVKYVIFCRSYYTNFPLSKSIHIWQLFLNIIEWLAKLRVFEVVWKIGLIVICHLKLPKNKKCRNSKIIKNFEILIIACLTTFHLNELIICFHIFPGKWFFSLLFLFFYSQPLSRFGWIFI